jgi:anion-transporting  ArsA/GET3 family ATPase
MAVETVYRLVEEEQYDLVVVDTPPARHAVDFLDAPRRLVALLDSRAFSILKDPTSILPSIGSRLTSLVLGQILRGLERFTGMTLIGEIGEFVRAIEALTEVFRQRVTAVDQLLHSPGTALVLVTAPEPRLATETRALAAGLAGIDLAIHGVVVNRALPQAIFGAEAPSPAALEGLPGTLADRLAATFADLRRLAATQDLALAPLLSLVGAPVLARVPLLATAPGTLDELRALENDLLGERSPVSPS